MTTTVDVTTTDGSVVEVADGDWIVGGRGEDRDYGRAYRTAGAWMVSWEWGAASTPLPEKGVDVYTSREAAAEAAERG